MRTPSERAHDMAEAAHGFEGGVEYLAADGVVDDVEAAAAGMLCNISSRWRYRDR